MKWNDYYLLLLFKLPPLITLFDLKICVILCLMFICLILIQLQKLLHFIGVQMFKEEINHIESMYWIASKSNFTFTFPSSFCPGQTKFLDLKVWENSSTFSPYRLRHLFLFPSLLEINQFTIRLWWCWWWHWCSQWWWSNRFQATDVQSTDQGTIDWALESAISSCGATEKCVISVGG